MRDFFLGLPLNAVWLFLLFISSAHFSFCQTIQEDQKQPEVKQVKPPEVKQPEVKPSGKEDLRIATYFPKDLLGYVEINDLSQPLNWLSGILEDSPLSANYKAVSEFREKAKSHAQIDTLPAFARISQYLTPEFRADLKKQHQLAFGLFGYDQSQQPIYAWMIDCGESNLAKEKIRAWIVAHNFLRVVGKSKEFMIYQAGQANETMQRFDDQGRIVPFENKPLMLDKTKPAYLVSNQIMIYATSYEITEKMLKSTEAKTSFADNEIYKSQKDFRKNKPVYFQFDPQQIEKQRKLPMQDEQLQAENEQNQIYNQILFEGVTFKKIHGAVEFQKNDWQLSVIADLDKENDLFSMVSNHNKPTIKSENDQQLLLQYKSSSSADDNANVLKFLDRIAKAYGTIGRYPSDIIKLASEQAKVDFAKELTDELLSIELFEQQRSATNFSARLQFKTKNAAERLFKNLQFLFSNLSFDQAKMTSSQENLESLVVVSFATGLPQIGTIHCAMVDDFILISTSRGILPKLLMNGKDKDKVKESAENNTLPGISVNLNPSLISQYFYQNDQSLNEAFKELPVIQIRPSRQGKKIAILMTQTGWQASQTKQFSERFTSWIDKQLQNYQSGIYQFLP